MKFLSVFMILISFNLLAEVAKEVFIRGKVHTQFDDKTVHVIDEFNEIIIIPRDQLPKDLIMQQGTPVNLEIDPDLLKYTKKKRQGPKTLPLRKKITS